MSREARKLGVHGWVRNLPDGTVEAVIEGDPERVEALIGWAHQAAAGQGHKGRGKMGRTRGAGGL